MALTDLEIRQANPRVKEWKLTDGNGLYLLVRPNGSKLWRFKYRVHGKEQKLSFGAYPEIGLKEARLRRDEARVEIGRGRDPARRRRQAKIEAIIRAGDTFEKVAQEYVAKCEAEEFASRVFRYAVATLRAEHDPCAPLKGALIAPVPRHYAAITDPEALGGLLRSIDRYQGNHVTMYALRMAPHVFVRPGELRHAEWSEFDLEKAVWRIPAGKMKSRRDHAVPLSRQVIALLEEWGRLEGRRGYVFPAMHTKSRPMSENTVNAALRRMGYSGDEMTAQGAITATDALLLALKVVSKYEQG